MDITSDVYLWVNSASSRGGPGSVIESWFAAGEARACVTWKLSPSFFNQWLMFGWKRGIMIIEIER